MTEFQKYMQRKLPEYRALVTDLAVSAAVDWKLGEITELDREDTFDRLRISNKDRKKLVKLTNQCARRKNLG